MLGGDAEAVGERVQEVLGTGLDAPMRSRPRSTGSEPDRTLAPEELEVAILDRNGRRRTFRRSDAAEIAAALQSAGPVDAEPAPEES